MLVVRASDIDFTLSQTTYGFVLWVSLAKRGLYMLVTLREAEKSAVRRVV